MHFTREPIIETVITARDGFKLAVRNSKGSAHEEYTVEAVEVVSFGSALFFRCLEKPRPFLVPVTDYEVLETKETRVLLKSVSLEKSIKIGGGREASVRTTREAPPEKEAEQEGSEEEAPEGQQSTDSHVDKRRDRRRHRRRRSSEERTEMKEWTEKKPLEEAAPIALQGGDTQSDETALPVSSPVFGTLIPPPTTLISESLARYKDSLLVQSTLSATKVNEAPEEEHHHVEPFHVSPETSEDSENKDSSFP